MNHNSTTESSQSDATPSMKPNCSIFNHKTKEKFLHIKNPFGGIPENLIINFIFLLILFLLFMIIQRSAWRWKKRKKSSRPGRKSIVFRLPSDKAIDDVLDGHDVNVEEEEPEDECAQINHGERTRGDDIASSAAMRRSQVSFHQAPLEGSTMTWVEWLWSVLTASDHQIRSQCGDDALQYLTFQRHIIAISSIVTLASIGVILPLNYQGTMIADSFGHTTLANINPDSNQAEFLWVHVCMSFCFFLLTIFVMRRFSSGLHMTKLNSSHNKISHTLMISGIPKEYCRTPDELRTHFDEAFNDVKIIDIKLVYDVRKLLTVYNLLKRAKTALNYCRQKKKDLVGVRDISCSRWCGCFCFCWPSSKSNIEFYKEEVDKYERMYETEKQKSLKTPLGIAFVTFKTLAMANDVLQAHKDSFFRHTKDVPKSSLSDIIHPGNWKFQYAKEPGDLYWENMKNVGTWGQWGKSVAVNSIILVIAIFATTPEVLQLNVIIKELDLKKFTPKDQDSLIARTYRGLIDFLPTLLIWSFTTFVPILVSWSDRFLGHWSRSTENHSIMRKTFWHMLMMVVVLPSIGLTSLQAVLALIVKDSDSPFKWECIFLPDSGSFFVNYAATAALAGAGLELLRLPELLWYVMHLCWSRSKAERDHICNSIKYEFMFGEHYARDMMIFCMTVMFSLSCPLITPMGTLYFSIRHFVDRHNLMYVYKRSKINQKVHETAIGYVVLSTLIQQSVLVVFMIVRSASDKTLFFDLKSKFATGLFLLSVNIYSSQFWTHTCRRFSPIKYKESFYISDWEQPVENTERLLYLPKALMTAEEKSNQARFSSSSQQLSGHVGTQFV